MESLLDDLRFSIRSLTRKPLVAGVAVLTLALGIGANTAVYSVIHAAVISPLPYPEPHRIARIYSAFEGRRCCPLSAPNWVDLRQRQQSFDDLVGYGGSAFTLTGDGDPVRVFGYRVSSGLFELLAAEPQIGRFIEPADDIYGAAPVVVIADRLWRDRYAGDAGALGSALVIDSVPHDIVGVAPPDFGVPGAPLAFVPFAWNPEDMPGRDSNSYTVLGRLRDGVSYDAAIREIQAIYADLVRENPGQITNDSAAGLPFEEWLMGSERRQPLLVLWGAVAMVLIVACANVANVMLARAETRGRELAVRAALGAPRGRLIRHFLSESMLVSLLGAALGVVGAWAGLQLLLANFGSAIPRSDEVGLRLPVMLFAVGVALATGLFVGLVPALQTNPARLQSSLRDGGRASTGGHSRLRQGLVVVEVATALILVVGAGLMLKSFWRLSRVDVGVDAERIVSVRMSLPAARYPETTDVQGFFTRIRDEIERLPAVHDAALASAVPFTNTYNNYSQIMPSTDLERVSTFVEARTISREYFATFGLPLLQGSNFDGSETTESEQVVVINRELSRQIFPADDAVGARIVSGPNGTPRRVIGVVENLLEHGPDSPPAPTIYFSHLQGARRDLAITARVAGAPLDVVPDIRRIARRIDAELPVFSINSLDGLIDQSLGLRRFNLSLLAIFAGLALALGAVGIYGVMAYAVEQRTREIGLRQALGATPGSVLGLVVGQGLKLVALGIVAGIVGAYHLRQTMASLLFEVSSLDAGVYAAVAAVLAAVAVAACLVPARRAAAVDPMVALRND